MGLDQASNGTYYSAGVSTLTASQQARTLASSLHRLRLVAATLEGSNDRTTQFLDALVGPELPKGVDASTATPTPQSFVEELHRLIDRIDGLAEEASRRSFALRAAAADPMQQTETMRDRDAGVQTERNREIHDHLANRPFGVASGRHG